MPREEHARRRITRVPLVTHPDLQSENEGLTSRMAVTGRASEDRLLEKAMRKLAKATFVARGLSVIKGVVIPEKRLNLGRIEQPGILNSLNPSPSPQLLKINSLAATVAVKNSVL